MLVFIASHDIIELRELHDEFKIFVFQKLKVVKWGNLLLRSLRLSCCLHFLFPWTLWRRFGHPSSELLLIPPIRVQKIRMPHNPLRLIALINTPTISISIFSRAVLYRTIKRSHFFRNQRVLHKVGNIVRDSILVFVNVHASLAEQVRQVILQSWLDVL